jgi:hypothetical protein
MARYMITNEYGDRIPLHTQWQPAGGRGLLLALLASMLLWGLVVLAFFIF